MVMGNGSNILVRDGGYRGIIIRMDKCCQEITGEGPLFTVGSAASLAAVAHYALRSRYCVIGILYSDHESRILKTRQKESVVILCREDIPAEPSDAESSCRVPEYEGPVMRL